MMPPPDTALRADRHRRFSAGAAVALAAALTLSARPASAQFAQSGSAYYVTGDYTLNADVSGYDVLVGKDTGGNTLAGTVTLSVADPAVVTQSANDTAAGGATYSGTNVFGANALMVGGGSVGAASGYDTSAVTINGGSVTFVTANNNATVAIAGGSVNNAFGNDFGATTISGGTVGTASFNNNSVLTIAGGAVTTAVGNDSATLNIMDGTVSEADALNASTLNVSGGTITDLFAFDTAAVNLSGGSVGGDTIYRESDTATLNFFGRNPVVYANPTNGTDANGNPGVFYDAAWTQPDGTVDNTKIFDAGGSAANAAPRGTTYTFRTAASVPEPGSPYLLLPALGVLGAVRFRRRKPVV